VTANIRTPAKLEHAVTAHSTIHPYGTFLFPPSIDIAEFSLTPSKTGLLKEAQRKHELLNFGCVAQWESFRGSTVISRL
jgi:hypothetical protein